MNYSVQSIILSIASIVFIISGCTPGNSLTSLNQSKPENYTPISHLSHKIEKLAVIAFSTPNYPTLKLESLAMERLSQKGYVIASRGQDLNAVLSQRRTSQSDIFDADEVIAIGKMLDVQAIFLLQVTEIGTAPQNGNIYVTHLNVVAKLLSTKNGGILWIKNVGSGGHGLLMLPIYVIVALTGQGQDVDTKVINDIMESFPPCCPQ